MTRWHILYRGSLSSCNYECAYCPFAKTSNTAAELRRDQAQLERFVHWVEEQSNQIGLLFTPWGEALIHRHYRQAMVRLSHLSNVYRVAVQTNLSAPIDDLLPGNRKSLALWSTFHPSQTTIDRFVARCRELDLAGIRYSVGVVGLKEHFDLIENLRAHLRPEVYLWVNAFKRDPQYYTQAEIHRLLNIDPYFELNRRDYRSFGTACSAGETSFSVDGHGDVRRCHFIKKVIGNIYHSGFPECLAPRPCNVANCGCYIGYIHRPSLQLDQLYGKGLLERIPNSWPVINNRFCPSQD